MQDNTTDEIVIKAMGRAINKTVVIVELLKVGLLLNKTSF
jgi:ribonuclease P/MRP protein subunit RPP25